MDLRSLTDIPPWEWPEDTGTLLLDTLRDDGAHEPELLLAAEFAGDLVVINDELVDALLAFLRSGNRSETLRVQAAISLGPVLEYADTDGFDDLGDVPIDEQTFGRIRELLRRLYRDADVPTAVRRGILEASVRAPQDWHPGAVGAAWSADDAAWRLTAIFCMRYVRGFDAQILEALDSQHPDVRYQAVVAAGNWGVKVAWSHVVALVASRNTEKSLLLAAIDAVASIRPDEAVDVLSGLLDTGDEDIVAAVHEALAMAEL